MTHEPMEAREDWVIDWRYKGFPPTAAGVLASRISEARWRLQDFTTPIAALRESALAHNLSRMREFCREHNVQIAPHGKTTMSPELLSRQLAHGTWAMTAATTWQARIMLTAGATRVLIANECVDPVGLTWIAECLRDHPGVWIGVFVDSLAAVEIMRTNLRGVPSAPPVPVLVELGADGHRAGARDLTTALEVARAIGDAQELQLVGVAGFEGVLSATRTAAALEPVRAFLRKLRMCAVELMRVGAFRHPGPIILSAGGSAFFDQVVEILGGDRGHYPRPVEIVLRSGCYVVHDHGAYHDVSPFRGQGDKDFQPALEVRTRVISTPEPGLAIIDAGKRDLSADGRMPVVVRRLRDGEWSSLAGIGIDHLNDQHGYLRSTTPDDSELVRVGDVVVLGISHPCTTLDKWRAIPVVDDRDRVTSVVRTNF